MKRIVSTAIAVSYLLILVACDAEDYPAPGGTAPTAPEAGATDRIIYVSPEGDDSASGAEGEPFGTLARAVEAARAGDTILLLPGIYHEQVNLEGVGFEEAPIAIRGDSSGEAILDGESELAIGFWCTGCTNLVIENLTFRNYTDLGIGFTESRSIRLSHLTTHNNGFDIQMRSWGFEGYGIFVDYSHGVVIEDCIVYENGPVPKTARNPLGMGINVFGCTGCQIARNECHDNIGGGILVEDSVDVLVEDNNVHDNEANATDVSDWWDGGLWLDGGYNVTVRGNRFTGNLGPGVQISDEDDQDPYGYIFEYNTVTGNYFGLYIWGFGSDELPPEDILRLEGNTISGNRDADMWISAGWCLWPGPCDEE